MDIYTYQCRLGASATRDLKITNRNGPVSVPSSIIQPEEAYIFRLPDELLGAVVKFAHETCPSSSCPKLQSYPKWCDNCCLRAVLRVCHRLRNLAEPLLYASITFEPTQWQWQDAHPGRSILLLHRTLKHRPDLRRYCR
jgi:hypothetical protein